MSFGAYLRDLRRSRCVPLTNALAALGDGPHAVTEFLDLEMGLRLPRIDELRRLAAFFGVPEAELLRRAGYVGAAHRGAPVDISASATDGSGLSGDRAEIPHEGAV